MMIRAVGGPLDGMEVPCRFPIGLVLGNKPRGEVLVYKRRADRLVAEGQIQDQDTIKIHQAANEDRYDVLAYDPERMGPWQR
jgi:hypothetical protein